MTSTTSALITLAVARVREALAAVGDLDRRAATPCAEFDFAALTDHVVGTTAALGRVGRGEALDAEDPWGAHTRVWPDWRDPLDANLAALARAWSEPSAWAGTVNTGGGDLPAGSIGEMAYAEVLLHGWDVTCAAGRPLTVDGPEVEELLRIIVATAELGRQMGAYGVEVVVPETADAFLRALGLAGRDPSWRPPGAREES